VSLLDFVPSPAASWHGLLAPLPDDATPIRTLLEGAGVPEKSAVAGWEQLVLTLTAGVAGLRNVLVVVDGDGQPIAASDHVLYRIEDVATGTIEYQQLSIGGRIEPDGSFNGTCWHSASTETTGGEQLESASESSAPTSGQVAELRALVAHVLGRAT